MDSMIDKEPIEQKLRDELSLPKVKEEPPPQEPKECALPIISTLPQHTPSLVKISFLPSISA